jgi:hypothetical protein
MVVVPFRSSPAQNGSQSLTATGRAALTCRAAHFLPGGGAQVIFGAG